MQVASVSGIVKWCAIFTYDEVIPDVVRNFIEEWYAHAGVLVVERWDAIGVVGGFGEEGQCESPPFVRGLVGCVVSMALY